MIRTRSRFNETFSGDSTVWFDGSTFISRTDHKFVEGQKTIDDRPTGFPDLAKARRQRDRAREAVLSTLDLGGPFESTKFSCEVSGENRLKTSYYPFTTFDGWQFARYVGADPRQGEAPWLLPPHADESLFAFGGTAISRCSPANPHASLYNTIVELKRDGLPLLPGLETIRKRNAAGLSSDYLNYEFALKPLFSDLRSLAQSARRAESLLSQYVRDSGRVVRRGYEFPVEVRSERSVWAEKTTPVPTLNTYAYGQYMGPGVQELSSKTKRWFKGAFTYYVNESSLGGLKAELQKMQYLYGVLPTPDAIYNLIPWTWLIDWFVNLGDVVNNISLMASDGLVMRYGYIMEHLVQDVRYNVEGVTLANGTPIHNAQEFRVERKLRRKASPFGFGLTEDAFTTRQWAILTALGMTRGGALMAK